MLLGPRSIAVSHRVVLCFAQSPDGSPGPVRVVRETEGCSLCPDDSVLRGNGRYTALRCDANECSPKKINRDRHSSFTERTQRSANAFRFGLRAGNFRGFTLPACITSRNAGQNLPSRSCSR
jgi:hypothetical protein